MNRNRRFFLVLSANRKIDANKWLLIEWLKSKSLKAFCNCYTNWFAFPGSGEFDKWKEANLGVFDNNHQHFISMTNDWYPVIEFSRNQNVPSAIIMVVPIDIDCLKRIQEANIKDLFCASKTLCKLLMSASVDLIFLH